MNKRPSGLKIPSKIARPTAANQSSRASSPTNSHSGISQNTDDFIVGDRIWVGGNKPGHIQFIGETKFAPGEWAGIVLDEPIGKNDGSMGGTRYFMCEPKRGIFSRLSKLTRESTNGPSRDSQNSSIMTERSSTPNRASSPDADRSSMSSSTRRAVSPIDGTTRTTKQTKRVSASPNTGGQVLTTTTTTTVKHDAQPVAGGGVKIGDRVLVGGTKAGVLRYIGTADFADGSWCGVELDEPLGKNDGTVAGKKYFDCKTKYGLFAQTHKVSKQPGSSTVTRVVRTTRVASNSPTPLSKRSGSQESLGSMSSTSQRSTLGSRVRLGVTSLTSPGQKSGRPQAANVTATTTALQESLRQKEQHIEQLLKEREMERSEISRAAAQVDAAEAELASLKSAYELYGADNEDKLSQLHQELENETQNKNELLTQLDEEKRKTEDLEFQLEEAALSKGDEDVPTKDDDQLQQLQQELEKERKRCAQLEKSCNQVPSEESMADLLKLKSSLEQEKLKSSQLEDMCENFQAQVRNLSMKDEEIKRIKNELESSKRQLEEAHGRIVGYEMQTKGSQRQSPSKMPDIEKEIVVRDDEILQLRASLEHKKKDVDNLQARVAELEREIDSTKKRNQRQQEIIDNLNIRLKSNESSSSSLTDELQDLKALVSDMQRKLNASQEKCENIQNQKNKLENQLTEFTSASGDSSKQLSKMNEAVQSRERQIEALTAQLAENSPATIEIDRLHEKIKCLEEETKMDEEKQKILAASHEQELEKKSAEIENEKTALKKKEAELMQINAKLQESELKADCGSDQFRRVQSELNATKNRFEKLTVDSEAERATLSSKLSSLEVEQQKLRGEKQEAESKLQDMDERTNDLINKIAVLSQEKEEQVVMVDDRDAKLVTLKEEVAKLNSEFSSHKEELHKKLSEQQLESGAVSDLHDKLQQYHSQMMELQEDFTTCEQQNQDLRSDVERLGEIENQNIEFENECSALKKQIQALLSRDNQMSSELKSETDSLRDLLNSSQKLAEERKNDLENMHSQINQLNMEKSEVLSQERQRADGEKKVLENKVNDLQLRLSTITPANDNDNQLDPNVALLKEEKESLDAQIDFLNSVIVDMQKKNDDLAAKAQILESGIMLDTNDINLNGIKSSVVAPRLFCDICDVFDLHDTEDCPKQAMSQDSPPPTRHNADRGVQRLYCETCEVFGHDSGNCDDDKTF